MRVLVDTSSVCWMALLAGKDKEHGREIYSGDKKVWVNSALYGYENAVNHLAAALRRFNCKPSDMIFVVEGQFSKALRKLMLPQYKETRDSRPQQAYEEFNALKGMLVATFGACGALAVTQDGVEGDDTVAYLAANLEGEKLILSNDGDLAALIGPAIHLWRRDELDQNPCGPFPHRFIPVYKALVGDTSDNIPGARGFGEKAFLNLYVKFGDEGLEAMQGLIERKELDRLVEDLDDFPALQKIIDGAEMVYKSWDAGSLHPEWCNTLRQPFRWTVGTPDKVDDERLRQWAGAAPAPIPAEIPVPAKKHVVFDCELIGSERPVFLVCTKILETGETNSFWLHKEGDLERLGHMITRYDLTWVSFNGINFDAPIISAALDRKPVDTLKQMAHEIIHCDASHWDLPSRFGYDHVEFDHIDLAEVAPGVKISLKTYAGRMGYPSMIDLPFHYDQDLSDEEMVVLEDYCRNDLGVTEALFRTLSAEIDLRKEMSEQYGIDLRSKSDAQIAEAVLKKACGLRSKRDVDIPRSVRYKTPDFIKTDSPIINGIIAKLEACEFRVNPANGQVEAPEFLKDPVKLGYGTYQMGIGGLHSTHDVKRYMRATDDTLISDYDVASYYPSLMLKAGIIPPMSGDKGKLFIDTYSEIVRSRIAAKRRVEEIDAEIEHIEKELAAYG